jgi:hypothetical protein
MKPNSIFILIATMMFCGCDREAALDRANLQPYTNIQPGTLVFVHYTMPKYTNNSTPIGDDYIFLCITNHCRYVMLRDTNGMTSLFAGRVIQSITPKSKQGTKP